MTNETRLWTSAETVAIKICGVRNVDTALEIGQLGVHAVGLHMFRGRITQDAIDRASEICQWLPDDVTRVILTDLMRPSQIVSLFEATAADTLQLQSPLPLPDLEGIAKRLPGLKIIKALPGSDEPEALRMLRTYEPFIDGFLVDSSTSGGTGRTFDWSVAKRLQGITHLPLMIAGGLMASNVAEAISAVRPFAVDVESGVEVVTRLDNAGRVTKKWTSIQKVIDFQRAVQASAPIEKSDNID